MSREIDAAVAEFVMGWKNITEPYSCPEQWLNTAGENVGNAVPLYSTDIAAAWEVLCHQMFWEVGIARHASGHWDCWLSLAAEDKRFLVTDESPAIAICRASLKAVGYKLND